MKDGETERSFYGGRRVVFARFGLGTVGFDHNHLQETRKAAVLLKLPFREVLSHAIIVKIRRSFVVGHEALKEFLVLAVAIDRL